MALVGRENRFNRSAVNPVASLVAARGRLWDLALPLQTIPEGNIRAMLTDRAGKRERRGKEIKLLSQSGVPTQGERREASYYKATSLRDVAGQSVWHKALERWHRVV